MSTTSALPVPTERTAAMPAYRGLLEDEWRNQVAEITRLALGALDGPDGDGPWTEDLHVAAELIAAARQRLEETEAALHRIDAGSYGRCVNCGHGITAQRLEVLPAARYCVRCRPTHHGLRR